MVLLHPVETIRECNIFGLIELGNTFVSTAITSVKIDISGQITSKNLVHLSDSLKCRCRYLFFLVSGCVTVVPSDYFLDTGIYDSEDLHVYER